LTETPRTKLFTFLFLAGFIGILSVTLIDISAVVKALPASAQKPLPMSPWLIKLVSLIQPSVILAIATFVGLLLAPRVGLSAPAFEALSRGQSFTTALLPQIIPGLVGGLIGAVVIVLSWAIGRTVLPPEFAARAEQFNRLLPIPTRLLYGGVTEEIFFRWGLVTLLVWAAWRLLQHAKGQPKNIYFVCAILVSSIIFGLGHLPLAIFLGSGLAIPILLYVIVANSIFGVIAGCLYWRKGLEAAIIAHMLTHVGIITASYLA
jgi:hypothetical protein